MQYHIALELNVFNNVLPHSFGILGECQSRYRLSKTKIGRAQADYQMREWITAQTIFQYMRQLRVSERHVQLFLWNRRKTPLLRLSYVLYDTMKRAAVRGLGVPAVFESLPGLCSKRSDNVAESRERLVDKACFIDTVWIFFGLSDPFTSCKIYQAKFRDNLLFDVFIHDVLR